MLYQKEADSYTINGKTYLNETIGKCNKCHKENIHITVNFWAEPQVFYLCDSCREQWHMQYDSFIKATEEEITKEFKIFMGLISRHYKKFIFR